MKKPTLWRIWILIPVAGLWMVLAGTQSSPPDWGAATSWNRTYGGPEDETPHPVFQTSDGGYVVAGSSWSYDMGDYYDAWLVKTGPTGEVQWTRTFGGVAGDEIRDARQTADGGFVLAGITHSFSPGYHGDFWLIRTDDGGREVWSRNYGGYESDAGLATRQTADGGYVIAGRTESYGAGGTDAWLVRTDANGNELWSKTFGGLEPDVAYSVLETGDGGFVFTGETSSSGAGATDVWLIRTDEDGTELWRRTFGGVLVDGAHCVQQTADLGYILAGGTMSQGAGSLDGWLIKTDANGNEQWNRTFGGADLDLLFFVEQTPDGGYAASGTTYSAGAGGGDVWLVRTDGEGNEIWSRTFGGAGQDESFWLGLTADGGTILSAKTQSFGAGEGDFQLIKTDASGNAPQTPSQP